MASLSEVSGGNMKRHILLLLTLSVLALVVGCGAAEPAMRAVQPAQPTAPPAMEAPSAPAAVDESASGYAPSSQDQERMIVYTGSLSLQVNDTAETVERISGILQSVNGYIASKSLVAYGEDKLRGTIVVRIPAPALDTTLDQIKALGIKVLREDANSNDVTA